MKVFIAFSIASLVASCYAADCQEPWDTLEHTFIPTNAARRSLRWGKSLPRQITVAEDESCVNEVGDSTYYGIRRQTEGDEANNIVTLYDKNGIVAGIQVRFNKSAVQEDWNKFRYDQVPMFRTESTVKVDYFVLTAYFVDPETICTEGRTADDLNSSNGTGYTLLFQNGPTPKDLMEGPMERTEALKQKYTDLNCFFGMGQHTYYDVSSWDSKNCTEIVPVFLLQNRIGDGCLVGFGFAWVGTSKSPVFEQPPKFGVQAIFGSSAPQCITDLAAKRRVTTIHFFFTKKPQNCGGFLGTGLGAGWKWPWSKR